MSEEIDFDFDMTIDSMDKVFYWDGQKGEYVPSDHTGLYVTVYLEGRQYIGSLRLYKNEDGEIVHHCDKPVGRMTK